MTHNDFKVGFLCGSDGKVSACNARDPGRSLDWKDYQERRMTTHFSFFCLDDAMDRADYSPWGCNDLHKIYLIY